MSREMRVLDVNGIEYEIVDAEARSRIEALEQNSGGGYGGTNDYNNLENKPQIESITLVNNQSYEDLGLAPMTTLEIIDTFNLIFG